MWYPRQPLKLRQANAAAIEFFTASAKPWLQKNRNLQVAKAARLLAMCSTVRAWRRLPARSKTRELKLCPAMSKAAAEVSYPNRAAISARNSDQARSARLSSLSPAQRLSFFPLPLLVTAEAPCHRALPAIDRSVFSLFRFRPIPAAAESLRCNK